jgi:hypothetical protein
MYFNYQNLSTGWCLTYLLWLSKSNEISYKIKNWIQRAGTIPQKKKIRKQIKIVVGIDVQNSSLFNEFVCKLGFFWMSGPV